LDQSPRIASAQFGSSNNMRACRTADMQKVACHHTALSSGMRTTTACARAHTTVAVAAKAARMLTLCQQCKARGCKGPVARRCAAEGSRAQASP
jgi:hypothetical protein